MKKEYQSQDKIKYILILSQRYSGSTLLSFILSKQANISTIGERRKFYNKSIKSKEFGNHRAKICSCGKTFDECPYLNTIKANILQQIDQKALATNTTEFDIFNHKKLNKIALELIKFWKLKQLPSIPFSNKIKDLKNFNQILVKEILKIDQNHIFLDSSKSAKHLLFLSMIEAFDLNVVWLVRDPRAQVNSAIKYNSSWSLKMATEYWKQEMVDNKKLLEGLGIKYTQLRYEDLCQSPKEEIKNILDFSGIHTNEVNLNFRNQAHHIMGNGKMRLGNEKEITLRSEWKQELNPQQIQKIEKRTTAYQDFYS
jgi:hypothetical protein